MWGESQVMDKITLTKKTVEGLEPQAQSYTVRDAKLAGFSVRVYPGGRRAFFYRYRVGGGRGAPIREPRIGDFGSLTVDQARSIAKDWAAEVRRGGDPAAARSAVREAPTMSMLFDRYLTEHAAKRKKPAGLRNDTRMIEKELKPAFGRLRVKDMTRQQIRAYHAGLEATPFEANRRLALLSKVFSFAADELEWIARGDHPVKGVKRYKEEGRRRYLSDDEIRRLGAALKKAEDGQLERVISLYALAMLRLALLTGARHSEILTLRWDEVNLTRGCLELGDSKTGRKEVFLSLAAREVLTTLPRVEGNPFVIVGANPGSHMVNVKDSWGAIRREAGLGDVRIHDLRHTFASLGIRAGMSLPLIGKLLGHASVQTTARYAHLASDPLQTAVNSISAGIDAAIGEVSNGTG